MTDFTSKKVLITGGASGIGRLVALKIAKKGGQIIIWDIHDGNLEKVDNELKAAGYTVNTYHCDVSDRKNVYSVAEKVKKDVGKIDILINNAGVISGKPFLECTDEQLERSIKVNTLAHFWTVKAFLPDMVRTNSGHIVTISSAAGICASSRLADYSTSKFAAFGFDESLRMEFKKNKLNIQTTVVCPYFINTGMFKGVKTRFSFLLPILEEDYAAARIVHSIEKNKRRLIMPWLVYTTWPLRLLPVSLFDFVANILGINATMDEFVGRRN